MWCWDSAAHVCLDKLAAKAACVHKCLLENRQCCVHKWLLENRQRKRTSLFRHVDFCKREPTLHRRDENLVLIGMRWEHNAFHRRLQLLQ